MTKKNLEELLATSKKKMDNYVMLGDKFLSMYELGRIESFELVLTNLDSIVVDEHENELMRRATEEAKYYIREYFQNKYRYDDEWSTDEIEDRIKRAMDEGDAETIANSFIDSADDGIPNDEWCETIVRDFYD
jgi:hypothetical protein